MSQTLENTQASLFLQLEISRKIVEMASQLSTMTNLKREAEQAYQMMNDILLAVSVQPGQGKSNPE